MAEAAVTGSWIGEGELGREEKLLVAGPVKTLLVREFTLSREDYDLATMVDLANKVLAWLNGVNADYTELYNAVRDLSCHAELSSVESELRTRQNDETEAVLSGDELRARSREGTEELARSEAEYMKATGPLKFVER
nr:hypothetical protein CFP56_69206 [Quercus suber]